MKNSKPNPTTKDLSTKLNSDGVEKHLQIWYRMRATLNQHPVFGIKELGIRSDLAFHKGKSSQTHGGGYHDD